MKSNLLINYMVQLSIMLINYMVESTVGTYKEYQMQPIDLW